MPTQEQDGLGVDGKSIKATLSNYDKAYQDFINVVSVFNTRCGVAIAILRYNGCSSITTAVRMIGHNKRADFSHREGSTRSLSYRCLRRKGAKDSLQP